MSLPYVGDSILVRNKSNHDIQCFCSKYSNNDGSEAWFNLRPDYERWNRNGWDLVAFKNSGDTQRAGVYINARGKTTYITFHSFDKIDVQPSE
ncbi:hypothetical protein NLI96_g1183 [Meripilus lineatus]|uniref:Uncharacterized protein n=1 Tax=Meripilus lineatus TaxID=2056292 RepID=A0AAD5VAY4_9APHY|nr:hypothetical protein NLI96_g1183 [Physisporinus lineatus]